jgi:hypothetical protein
MTRNPTRPPIHAIPLRDRQAHIPSPSCPCGPTPAFDLLSPTNVVFVHRAAPVPADGPYVSWR